MHDLLARQMIGQRSAGRLGLVVPGLDDLGHRRHPQVLAHVTRDANPNRRPGSPSDIAEACIYLAMPSSRFVTGEVLTVDGGQQLWGDVWAVRKPEHFHFDD
jgi:citronellol/citronellal dehydrogenase